MERAKAIFEYALDLEPEEREQFLQHVSSEDPELLREVRLLLDEARADTQELPAAPPPDTKSRKYIFSSGDLIADRYRVLRAIARGGMGEVYEVQDRELHGRVALKVISLKSAAKPNAAEMFRREITLARQVTHPNVCRIYDIGHHDHPEHGDLLFLTMEFLEGRTLAERIRTQGTLSKDEALPLLRQMVDALAAAHKLNIAHRDFKSANVILCESTESGGSGEVAPVSAPSTGSGAWQAGASSNTESRQSASLAVKVTDFGLARSVDAMETTFHGEIWGTPDYMAPEQFHGHSSTSSDIYALGVVIYEMFTAKLPHRSSTGPLTPDGKPSATMEKIPVEWQPVVRKCMAFDAADRYAKVEDVWRALSGDQPSQGADREKLRALRKTAVGLAAALVLVAGLTGWVNREAMRRWFNPVPEQKHIAVLRFENIGSDANNAAFAAGVGETLASRLSQLGTDQQTYWVVPFSDSRKYMDVEQARRNLDVTLIVTGSVQRTGDEVRMTVNVIDAKKHKQLASRVMTASVADLNLLQDQAWESVAQMVQQPVDPATKKTLDDSSTKNARAYDYYEQGVGYLQRGDLASVDNAIDAFKKSAAEDPKYVLAEAGLGNAYATKYDITRNPEWIGEAAQYANRAVALNPKLAPARETLAKVYEFSGKFDEALAEYRHVVELNPVSITAPYHIARIYERQGKYIEAEESYKRVIVRMPSSWLGYSGLGELYFNLGKFNEATQQYQKVIDLMPSNPLGYEGVGAAYEQMGEYQKAIAAFHKGLMVAPSAEIWSDLGAAYMFIGENAKAAEAMQHAVELNPHNHLLWRNLADGYRQVPSLANRANEAYQNALDAAQKRLAVNPQDKYALSGMALYEAHLGHRAEVLTYIDKTQRLSPNDPTILFTLALAYEIIGDRRRALIVLGRSLDSGFSLEDIKREPELQALRSDPRYQQMLSKSAGHS